MSANRIKSSSLLACDLVMRVVSNKFKGHFSNSLKTVFCSADPIHSKCRSRDMPEETVSSINLELTRESSAYNACQNNF